MAENLLIATGGKEEKYSLLYEQLKAMVENEHDQIANMANSSAMIHATFGFLWTGFYRVIGNELVLGPFQGPLACSRIRYGKGVCGTAWKTASSVIVNDVDEFPGHIACSSESRSEIVIPVFSGNDVIAVLDIDSKETGTFDDTDRIWLEKAVLLLAREHD